MADVNLFQDEANEYIEISVTPSNIPISYRGVYHYRSGSTKQELNGTALQQFLLKKMGRSWDDMAYEGVSLDIIDEKAVTYFLNRAIAAQRMPASSLDDNVETVLDNLNLIDNEHKLKNAAILLFAKRPEHYFPSVQFKIGRFGKDDTDLIFQDVVEGDIIRMADRVMDLLKSKYLISPIHYEGLQRIEPLEVPESALREAIFNSIIHKQYATTSVQMSVYNDRIMLWNEGNIPYTIEQLMQKHSSRPQNPLIANAFYKAGFIESWGRGIDKIKEGFTHAGLQVPTFEYMCGGMVVTMFRRTFKEIGTLNGTLNEPLKLSEVERSIINIFIENPVITREELSDKMKVSIRTIQRALDELKKKKLIMRVGSKKSGKWLVDKKGEEA